MASFEEQLKQTLNTLKASKDEESKQTLAAYQHRQIDKNQETLDLRNRKVIASRIYRVDHKYFQDCTETKAPNPFVNIRDLRNIDALFKKLNDTMDKLELFKKKACGLPDIEIVKKKLEEFGQALGFVEDNVAKMDKNKRD